MILTPKNWNSFQHYKDRCPSWIKLHRRILDDCEFHSLPVASRALAPLLWLLASEYDNGAISAEPRHLAFRLRMDIPAMMEAVKPLVAAGFFTLEQDASGALAECYQPASPEKRREREREEAAPSASAFALPDWVPLEDWEAYLEMRKKNRKAPTENAKRLVVVELEKLRGQGQTPSLVLQQSVRNGWTDVWPLKANAGTGPATRKYVNG